eukprot:scaffold6314_cov273-Ochromonas_danica.AAC.30
MEVTEKVISILEKKDEAEEEVRRSEEIRRIQDEKDRVVIEEVMSDLLDTVLETRVDALSIELEVEERRRVEVERREEETISYLVQAVSSDLQRIAESGDVTLLKVLEACQAVHRIPAEEINQSFTQAEGATALCISASKGHDEIVRLLLLHPEIAVNAVDIKNRRTAFFAACYGGHKEVVKRLIEDNRVDITIADKAGNGPLLAACYNGEVEVVRLLLQDIRVDVIASSQIIWSALLTTRCRDNAELIRPLVVRLLSSDNAHQQVDERGITPLLIIACTYNLVRVVEVLLEDIRVDVNVVSEEGRTVLVGACWDGFADVVRVLLRSSEVDVTLADKNGWDPLLAACSQGHVEVIQVLLQDDRVDVNADREGWTVLHEACQEGRLQVVEALLQHSHIDVNKADQGGWAPLHAACAEGHMEIVRKLLSHDGVNVNQADENGHTPLDVAATEEIEQLLTEHGARARNV